MDSPQLHIELYFLAFLQRNLLGMGSEVAWASGKPDIEYVFLYEEARTAAYLGQLRKARELSHHAEVSAEGVGEEETSAGYQDGRALWEALFGNNAEAHQTATAALHRPAGRYPQYAAALALAIAGDSGRAQAFADDSSKRFPEDTIVQSNLVPLIHAQVNIGRGNPSKAIEILQSASLYELGETSILYPAYLRGQAYLKCKGMASGGKRISENS
jgi:eukaryotic-like serine/threonine-protein kinase